MTFTRLNIALRDALYYKLFPFALKWIERFEAPRYARQKKQLPQISTFAGIKKAKLFLTHGRGGGVDKHVEEVASALEAEGGQAWMLYFKPIARKFTLARGRIHAQPACTYKFPSQYAAMVQHLHTLGLSMLHIHHTRYLPYILLKDLPDLAKLLGVKYDYMMHDFIAICPREHLIDSRFHYCGMPEDARECNACVAKNGTLTTSPGTVEEWRELHRIFFGKASALFAPSHDTAQRHKQILGDDIAIEVVPHDEPFIKPRRFAAKAEREPYVVAVVGRLHRHKGADVLVACAQDARARKLPLRFAVMGDSVYDDELRKLGVTSSGVYKEEDLAGLLEESRCSLVFLPSVWPETYSYVLSHVWQYGYFPVAFDLGAPAERIRQTQNGMTLPLAMIDSPSSINDALLKAAHAQHAA